MYAAVLPGIGLLVLLNSNTAPPPCYPRPPAPASLPPKLITTSFLSYP